MFNAFLYDEKVDETKFFWVDAGFCYHSAYDNAFADPITSAGNAEVKRLRSLHERKFRRQTDGSLPRARGPVPRRWSLAGAFTGWPSSTGEEATAWSGRFCRRWSVTAGGRFP